MPFDSAEDAYEWFDKKLNGCTKVVFYASPDLLEAASRD